MAGGVHGGGVRVRDIRGRVCTRRRVYAAGGYGAGGVRLSECTIGCSDINFFTLYCRESIPVVSSSPVKIIISS
jgi:hypothetical protein